LELTGATTVTPVEKNSRHRNEEGESTMSRRIEDERSVPGAEVASPLTLGIRIVQYDDEAVIAVDGELDIATAPMLQREVEPLWSRPMNVLTVDLERVDFMDSSGLRALNELRTAAEERDVTFALFGVQPRVRRVLDVTGMGRLFELRTAPARRT
jgi:anti-sigma B factor antagonist